MSSSPSSAPSFSLSLSLSPCPCSERAFSSRVFDATSAPFLEVFLFKPPPPFQSKTTKRPASFLFSKVEPFFHTKRRENCCCKFSRSLFSFFVSATKETKISFFARGSNKKKGRKNKKEKRIELPPPQARLYISKSPILYYRHKSSSRSVAGAKTRKRRLFSGGVDFFAGFNRARL